MTNTDFPRMALVGQTIPDERLQDVRGAIRAEMDRLDIRARVKPGQTVAITAGSRGIDNMPQALACLCEEFKALGAAPFVFPAMGSHGGATAEGQIAVLASYGITEEFLGAPIRSSMDTVLLGETEGGLPVYTDAWAAQADHVVAVNRVKSHTKFKAPIESGLHKILGIGMGKHRGAALMHKMAVGPGMHRVIMDTAGMVLSRLPMLMGLGLVDNGHGRTHTIRGLLPAEFEQGEAELLKLAKELSPKLPLADIDLLVVDEMGKNISGTGMDTNVTGRNRDIVGDFCTTPRCKRIVVRDLTPESGGNATGIGFADFTTDRLVAAMDYHKTVTNALTGISPEKAAIPVHLATDRKVLGAALDNLGMWRPESVGVVRIKNTLHLDRLLVSEGALDSLPSNCHLLTGPQAMAFGPDDNLVAFPD